MNVMGQNGQTAIDRVVVTEDQVAVAVRQEHCDLPGGTDHQVSKTLPTRTAERLGNG